MSMFNDISCGTKDNEEECLAHVEVVSLCARKFGTGQWSFSGPGSEKKWYSVKENSPQGIWGQYCGKDVVGIRRKAMPISVLRHHCLEENSKAKDMENCRFILAPLKIQLTLFFQHCFCKSAQSLRSSSGNV